MVWDDASLRCLIIDPASEKSLREIEFIESHNLTLDYILLTHEHTDHTWGVNALLDKYDAKVVCSQKCKENLPKAGDAYFLLYYGTGGFHGYLVFVFKQKNIVIMENMIYGNATYVFNDDWKELSKLSKAEIIQKNLHLDRLVHSEKWVREIKKLLF